MEKQIQQVLEFHKTYRCGTNIKTFEPFRGDLQIEEAKELKQAIEDRNMVEIADAVMDSIYVAIGTAVHFGFHDKLIALFDAVHKSNMSKVDADGNPIIREDGKVLKGPNYKPPTEDIESILNEQHTPEVDEQVQKP